MAVLSRWRLVRRALSEGYGTAGAPLSAPKWDRHSLNHFSGSRQRCPNFRLRIGPLHAPLGAFAASRGELCERVRGQEGGVPEVGRVLAALPTAHALYMQKTKATSGGRGKRARILRACALALLL